VDLSGARGVTDVPEMSLNHIFAHLVSLQRRGLRDTTRRAHARGINTFLNRLMGEGLLGASPMSNAPMSRLEKRVPRPYSRYDVQRLLEACDP